MASALPSSGYILGLDVGGARIGAALASVIARLPQPIDVIPAGDEAITKISQLIQNEQVEMVIIGIPRNLEGSETAQSAAIREFAEKLAQATDKPIAFADESLSSHRADEMTRDNTFQNVSQDSLAACFILEEFFATIDTTKLGE